MRHNADVVDSTETAERIARNLLEARRRLGLTLAEAAAAIGVSVTHLSRVERGERQPSIGVLIELARSYRLPLGQLVGDETAGAGSLVIRGRETPVHDGADGAYAAFSGITGADLLEAIRLELREGSHASAAARHAGEEWLLVQSGSVSVEIGSQTHNLEPGDAVHFDAQTPHRLHNVGHGTATVFVVSASAPVRQAMPHR